MISRADLTRVEVALQYCSVCQATTEQVHLRGDITWRCRKCENELIVIPGQNIGIKRTAGKDVK